MTRKLIEKYLGNVFKEDSSSASIKTKIVDFFTKNPNPKDDQVHKFAEKEGINLHRLQTYIYSLLTEYIEGVGKHDHILDSKFDSKELQMGIEVEKEHTTSATIAKSIAKDHLAECSTYYTRLEKMEKECEER